MIICYFLRYITFHYINKITLTIKTKISFPSKIRIFLTNYRIYMIISRTWCNLCRMFYSYLFWESIWWSFWSLFWMILSWTWTRILIILTSFAISDFCTLWSSFYCVFVRVVWAWSWWNTFVLLNSASIYGVFRSLMKINLRIVSSWTRIVFV